MSSLILLYIVTNWDGEKKARHELLTAILFLLRQVLQERSDPASPSESKTFQLPEVPQKILVHRLHGAALQESAF